MNFVFIFFSFSISGQVWEDMLLEENKNPTIDDRIAAFENYKVKHPYTKGNGYKPYARKINFVSERVANNSSFNPSSLYIEWKKEKEKYKKNKQYSGANWVALGPINTPIILNFNNL